VQAQVVLPCADLDPTIAFFVERLGFRVDAIHPADDPEVCVISGHGLSVRLERRADGSPGILRILGDEEGELTAPNGTRVVLALADPPVVVPKLRPGFVLTRKRDAKWIKGRAGMRYRDLIPGRQGGRFIASHIQIEDLGPVPDYVHFHKVRFQMIHCAKGWVKLVYEDQGPPFVLHAGQCVLQPPRIRHRVLEASGGLEVIELTSPAAHETIADHALPLPTPALNANREFEGQRFVTGDPARITEATRGLADAHISRAATAPRTHDAELLFGYVLAGSATLACSDRPPERLGEGDAFVVPRDVRYATSAVSDGFELLHVTVR
jgi:quercetin dioxygenase-like cupin family protein